MNPERLHVIKNCLNKRQLDLTLIMEHVNKPHNLAAVARTLEAVGGLEIHAITSRSTLRLSQMAAGGIRKWLQLHKHASTETCLKQFQQRGYQVVATTLSQRAKDYRTVDYTKPTAILVGEELEGISEQAVDMADVHITVPMVGMVQSLNVSVASALVLYEAFRQRSEAGLYNRRTLDDETYQRLLFEACHPKVANYCKMKNIPYPTIDEDAVILEPIANSMTHTDDDFIKWFKKTID